LDSGNWKYYFLSYFIDHVPNGVSDIDTVDGITKNAAVCISSGQKGIEVFNYNPYLSLKDSFSDRDSSIELVFKQTY